MEPKAGTEMKKSLINSISQLLFCVYYHNLCAEINLWGGCSVLKIICISIGDDDCPLSFFFKAAAILTF